MGHFDPNAAAAPGSGIFGLSSACAESRVVLLPVPFDATTSYHRGAAGGPAAIAEASRQVDLYDIETGRPYEAGIHLLPVPPEVPAWNEEARAAATPIIAAGGQGTEGPGLAPLLQQVNDAGEQLTQLVHDLTARHLVTNQIVGIIGGDHSVPLGAIAACAARHPGMGILHIDAHADLRRAYEGFTHSHASIMFNVAERVPGVARIVQAGIRDVCEEEIERIAGSGGRIVTHHDAALWRARFEGEPWGHACSRIVAGLPQEVYVSFDIDGLDPSLCPHTGTPVPGGLGFPEATALLRTIVRSGRRIVGFDLTEVAPGPDPEDDWDANVGARLLYKLIGFTLLSNPA